MLIRLMTRALRHSCRSAMRQLCLNCNRDLGTLSSCRSESFLGLQRSDSVPVSAKQRSCVSPSYQFPSALISLYQAVVSLNRESRPRRYESPTSRLMSHVSSLGSHVYLPRAPSPSLYRCHHSTHQDKRISRILIEVSKMEIHR